MGRHDGRRPTASRDWDRTHGSVSDRTDTPLPESVFVLLDDGVVLPAALSRGPWDPRALHGGPAAAWLAFTVEQVPSDDVDWLVSRLTIDLERPVPVEPLPVHAEVRRPGRKVWIIEATITRADSGAVLVRARALRIRTADVTLPLHDAELAGSTRHRTSPARTGTRRRRQSQS
jgi:Thioesterase-like superfamily